MKGADQERLPKAAKGKSPKADQERSQKVAKGRSPRADQEKSPKAAEITPELQKFQKLLKVIDDMVVFLEARGESLIFHKVKESSLEKLCGWEVKIEDLARLRAIYPDAYEYRSAYAYVRGARVRSVIVSIPREKGRSPIADSSEPKTPPPHTPEDAQSPPRPQIVCPSDYFCGGNDPLSTPKRAPDYLPPSPCLESPKLYMCAVYMRDNLKKRRDTLRSKLLALVEDSYPNSPDIPQHDMPELKLADPDARIASPKTPRTLAKRTLPESPIKRKIFIHTPASSQDLTPKTARMKRILEKVRLKQQAASPSRSKHSITQRAVLSRLPSIVQALSFLFSSFQKTVLPLDTILDRLKKCLPPTSDSSVREHIDVLVKLAPDWCSIKESDSNLFLKVDISRKTADVRSEVEFRVQEALEAEKF